MAMFAGVVLLLEGITLMTILPGLLVRLFVS
jgi:hypothetical protein